MLASAVRPQLQKVDLVFNLSGFVKGSASTIGRKAWENKIMTVLLILGLYATHKTYGFYRYIKQGWLGMLDPNGAGLGENAMAELLGDQELGQDIN